MVEINAPGDEIEAAANNIQSVIDLFDSTSTDVPSLQQALGNDPAVTGAAEDFKARWNDGRTQLRDEGDDIALRQVLQTFTDNDDQLGDSLTEKDAGEASARADAEKAESDANWAALEAATSRA